MQGSLKCRVLQSAQPRKVSMEPAGGLLQQHSRRWNQLALPRKALGTCRATTSGTDPRHRNNNGSPYQTMQQQQQHGAVATTASPTNSGTSTTPPALSSSWWEALPGRYKLCLATCFSFVIANMDKVNMSVAIVPMAMDFGWSPGVSGIVQSSFFYGYMLAQLPGGYIASMMGGRKVLPAGVGLWSSATCAVPILAATGIPGLFVSRALVGLGEAVAPAAATDMVARAVPPEERSRAVSFIFGGLHAGSIAGLLLAPQLIHLWGWRSVFVAFGAAGLAWVWWFESIMAGVARQEPELAAALAGANTGAAPPTGSSSSSSAPTAATATSYTSSSGGALVLAPAGAGAHGSSSSSAGGDSHTAGPLDASQVVPYRAFLRSRPVQALCFTHFCHNWLHYSMLAWLPTYFTSTLSVDLMHAAQTALFPPLAGLAASATAGPMADYLISRGVPLPTVRKLVQGASFVGPLLCLAAACSDAVEGSRTATVACITAALGLSSLSLAGLYCTHQDMSPRYASALLGLTNTVGAVPGILGVATVGFLYDTTHSWEAALFMPSMACMVGGALVYSLFAVNDPVDFDQGDNRAFGWEKYLPGWVADKLPWGPASDAAPKAKQQ